MLKPALTLCASSRARQPPSGGCVLKLDIDRLDTGFSLPAAFRRLCVETENDGEHVVVLPPAAFRRLCVETKPRLSVRLMLMPAAFKRLCVETSLKSTRADARDFQPPSGGCVLKRQTKKNYWSHWIQPPSGGCVLKRKRQR